ncbi:MULTISPECIES: DUF2332 domain-containing protein [unclassified Mesobacillus]|uniref:DUF2332 domain-containing protein n=1 Tax=unclassified Mesobacillus TaxID=2675270 RepID=UPI00203F9A51|nr:MULTISPECIES: DUF2332 domain-containing protein [unclassified Mesobacillus]MCM3123150.1 DUF2332 domain-containing protein [Mesobacillus sp. MER 33]MCM3233367.1 DUF2332 domain-containing protein [Mesobacillus sp. MER 48]
MDSKIFEKFKHFAVHECWGSSPLYECLSLKIAEDREMLELASKVRIGQPVPNLLLGAVHYLLMQGYEHPLAEFYPSLTDNPRESDEAFAAFVDFCREYREEITEIIESKIVQTNEVRRCSYLYPVFSHIYRMVQKPLALIEIGTSAGLQLFLDQYSYSYGTGQIYGKTDSPVHLTSKIEGQNNLFSEMDIPKVKTRIGIDLHINDVKNMEDYLWLNALIWPEHHERRELFEKAANFVANQSLRLIEGDGAEMLSSLAGEIPDEQVISVFHTHVANQMPGTTKKKLLDQVKEIGERRDIFHIYNNIYDSRLHLDYYLDGKESLNTIGETEGHGRWFSLNL